MMSRSSLGSVGYCARSDVFPVPGLLQSIFLRRQILLGETLQLIGILLVLFVLFREQMRLQGFPWPFTLRWGGVKGDVLGPTVRPEAYLKVFLFFLFAFQVYRYLFNPGELGK